jgi:arylsulfatase A-like enzyme
MKPAFVISLSVAITAAAAAQTMLIDFDDGIPGNGVHEASIRNGGFEEGAAGQSFAQTPAWSSFFSPEGDSSTLTLATNVRTGALRGTAGGWSGTGTRQQPAITIPAAAWTIAAGDVFTVAVDWRNGSGFSGQLEVVLQVVDAGGNPVQDATHGETAADRLLSRTNALATSNQFQTFTASSNPVPAGSPWIGRQIRLRLLNTGPRTSFAMIDNVSLAAQSGEPPPPPPPPPPLPATPNIVIIYGDDVGFGDVACYGSGIVATPRIDSLAAQGIRFTNVHAPASTCTPSRYSLLTGGYAWRTPGTGVASGVSPLLIRPGSVTLPSMLRQAGYATAVVGKWHLGMGGNPTNYNAPEITPGPREIGFDYWFGIPATNDRVPSIYMENRGVVNFDPSDPLEISFTAQVGSEPTGASHPHLQKYYTADTQHNGTIVNGISRIGWMTGMHAARFRDEDHADIFDAKSGAFIRQSVQAGKPFFLFLASPDVHVPRAPHERFQGASPHGWRGDAMLSLDWSVGALLDRLDDPDGDGNPADSVAANTIVIFASDNGPVGFDGYNEWGAGSGIVKATTEFPDGHDSNGPYSGGKYTVREGGTRVPFLIRWPGKIPAGAVSSALFSHTDFMATFAALTGQPLPTDAGPDSENVLDAMLGQSATGRSVLVTQNNNQNPKAIRLGNWKLHTETNALYNLASDPAEATNAAAANPALRSDLQARLAAIEATPMSSPLLGWWPLDEGAGGAARDLSGWRRHGSLAGAPAWLGEDHKPFLRFGGGNDDRVQVDGLPAIDGGFTIALWARSATAGFSGNGAFASRRPAFAFLPLAGSRQIRFLVTTASATQRELTFDLAGIDGFDLTAWHHYAAGYDAATGTLSLFVDGVGRAAAAHPPEALQAGAGGLFLGSDDGAAAFAGDLSDIRLHPLALTPQRIANTASSRLDDADGDGMLSDWEHRHGLDPFDPADAASDADGDGITNLDEFRNNTPPLVPDNVTGALRARWPLDATTGATAADASGNGHHGTLVNNPSWSSGPGRKFLAFNGTSQSVDVANLPDLRLRITAACWARSDTPDWNAAGSLVSRRPQFILHPWANSRRISFTVFHSGGTQHHCEVDLATIPGFSLTDWHHYAGSYDATTGEVRLYVDGYPRAATSIGPRLLDSTTGPLHLGRDVGLARYLGGAIDEAFIYDRTLAPAEILALAAGFDDDGDGLPDDFERRIIENSAGHQALADVNPADDPDGDGADNFQEWLAGTNPLDPDDVFRIDSWATTKAGETRDIRVAISGRAGRSYSLVESATLEEPWRTVDSRGPLAADQALELAWPGIPADRAFVRVRVAYTPAYPIPE